MWQGSSKASPSTDFPPTIIPTQKVMATTATTTPDASSLVEAAQEMTAATSCKALIFLNLSC
jgi:hypothetical protein